MRKVWGWLLQMVCPTPSLTDFVFAIGIIPIGFIDRLYQGIYLVSLSLLLFAFSIAREDTKKFVSPALSFILFWSFISIFLHSTLLPTKSVMYNYVNFSLMSESFIYILAGILLLKTVIGKVVNIRLLYLTIPIALIPVVNKMLYFGQVTPVFAVLLAFAFYFIGRQKKIFVVLTSLLALTILITNFQWVAMKFNCRPYVNIELLRQISENFWKGTGFNRFLTPDNLIWVRQIGNFEYGWLYRHNDFLSITAFMGVPILLGIVLFLKELFDRVRYTPWIIMFTAIVLMCCFQITMFLPDKALIIIACMVTMYCEA